MKLRGALYTSAMVATVVARLAALAQVPGTVTTSPVGAAAPALGMPMLVLLALALSVGAGYVLRRKAASATARLAVVAAATILAGIAYATMTSSVVVSGEQCAMRTTQTWNAENAAMLENQCSNALLIEVLRAECPTGPSPQPACDGGQSLAGGAFCNLPVCNF